MTAANPLRHSAEAAIETPSEAALPPRMQARVFHDLFLPEETRAVRAEVRAFAEAHIAPVAAQIGTREESAASFPQSLFARMGEAGLFAIPFGREDGGRGLAYPALATCAVIEELAYFSNGLAAVYDVHCILAGHALKRGNPKLRKRYLKPLTRGEIIGSFATSEPEASSDLSPETIGTLAERAHGGFRISGRKRWITNAPVSDFVVVLARAPEGLTTFVVDKRLPGVSVGPLDIKMGNKVQLTADVVFDDVFVPEDHIIGRAGGGLRVALETLTYGRVGIAASGVGMAQSAFDQAAAHMLERRVFGKRLAEMQHWQYRMAERATEIENARNLYTKAALRLDAGEAFPEPEAAMAKLYGTRLAGDMARDAIQVFGARGFVQRLGADGSTFRLEEIYRDAKIAEIYEGANEIQQWVIARSLFGRDVTG